MDRDKWTVLHVNTERTFRGGEIQTILLASELQRRGHRNVLFAQPGSPLADRGRRSGLATVEISMRGEWDVFAASKLRNSISDMAVDVVHAHTPHAGALALLAAAGRRQAAIVLSRRVARPIRQNFLSQSKYQRADAVLAVSRTVRNILLSSGLPPDKVCIAEDGTDFSIFERAKPRGEVLRELNLPESAFVIGNVGYFDEHKGQAQLIEAFARYNQRSPEQTGFLLLVGEGPMLARCRALAEDAGVGSKVVFAGYRSDVENMYAVMDLFFLATLSLTEGWSGVVTEAMAAGLPVIAVRQPTMEERITHGKNGWLVSPGDNDEWAEALLDLSRDSGLRSALAAEGKQQALTYTLSALAEKTEACYRAALDRTADRSSKR